jgi:hypothetical protein
MPSVILRNCAELPCARVLVEHYIDVRSMHLLGVNSATPRPGPDNTGISSPHDIPYAISRQLSNYPFYEAQTKASPKRPANRQ